MKSIAELVMWLLTVKDKDLSIWGRAFRWISLIFFLALSVDLFAQAYVIFVGR